MTIVSIDKKASEAEKLAERIKQLRDLFPLDYRPQFQVGDIVRFRPVHAKTAYDKPSCDVLFIVIAVKGKDESWMSYSRVDPEDDIRVAYIAFEKGAQREIKGNYTGCAWEFELVERADGSAP